MWRSASTSSTYLSTWVSSTRSSYFFTSWLSNFCAISPFSPSLKVGSEVGSPGGIVCPALSAYALTSCIVIGSPSTLATTLSTSSACRTAGAQNIASDATVADASTSHTFARLKKVLFSIVKILVGHRTRGTFRPAFQILTGPNCLQDGINLREGLVVFPFSHSLNLHNDLERRSQAHALFIRIREPREFRRIDWRIGMKTNLELISFCDRAQDHHRSHLAAHIHSSDEILDQRRHRTASIAHLVAQVREVLIGFAAREPSIKNQALVFVGHIMIRNVGGNAEAQLGLEIGPHRLPPEVVDRLLHHLRVQLESDRGDFAVLFAPEQIARAAMLEVRHRKFETTARFGIDQFLERLDAPLGIARDDVLAGNQQVRVCLLARASDPAAKLIQLRQPKMIGAIDDHRIRIRNIEPRFDNRGAHQQIDAVLDKIAHHIFQLMLIHLTMTDADPRLGNQRAQMAGDVCDVLDAVVHEKYLARAIQLAQNDFAHQTVFEMRDEGADHLPIRRRSLDHREIADAEHRHVQRARNRRRGQRKDINQLAQLLHLLFIGDAETMLLVDNQQSQLGELNVLGKQAIDRKSVVWEKCNLVVPYH